MQLQMSWQSFREEKILMLRLSPTDPWRPYNHFPKYALPDYQISGVAKGWATFLALLSRDDCEFVQLNDYQSAPATEQKLPEEKWITEARLLEIEDFFDVV